MRLMPVIDCQCGHTILVERADIDPAANRDRAQYVRCPACERVNSVTPYLWTAWLLHGFGEEAANADSCSESISASIVQTVVLPPPDTADPAPPASSPDPAEPQLSEAARRRKGEAAAKAVEECGTQVAAAKKLGISRITLARWLTWAPADDIMVPFPVDGTVPPAGQ